MVSVQLDDSDKTIVYEPKPLYKGDVISGDVYASTGLARGEYNAFFVIKAYDINDTNFEEHIYYEKRPVEFRVCADNSDIF